jgi:hypothetical protein
MAQSQQGTGFGVWCRVSGGVTGTREAWLTAADGSIMVFPTEDEASGRALYLNLKRNGPNARASFSYTAKPAPKA